jgi:hypothetical protein
MGIGSVGPVREVIGLYWDIVSIPNWNGGRSHTNKTGYFGRGIFDCDIVSSTHLTEDFSHLYSMFFII